MKKRILSIDLLRGLGIMTIIVIHRLHYHWTGLHTKAGVHEHFSSAWAPLIIAVIVLFTMAGIFYFISGIVNAYSFYHRVSSDASKLRKTVIGGVAGGLWFLILNYLYRIFFSNGIASDTVGLEPEFPVGYITGLVSNSANAEFVWAQITKPGTLAVIGLTIIFVSLTLGILLRPRFLQNKKRIFQVLIFLGFLFLILTPVLKYYLRPAFDEAYQMHQYTKALFIGYTCQEFSLAPYLGYGFLGAAIGLSLAMGENKKVFLKRNIIIMVLLFFLGISTIFLFDRDTTFGKWVVESGITYVELSIFFLMMIVLLRLIDFKIKSGVKDFKNKFIIIRGFGMVALTVYFLEPIVAELLLKVAGIVVGNLEWTNQIYWVFVFAVFCLIIWMLILYFWKKVNFIGSLEWLSVKLLFASVRKHSGKTDFESIKKNPDNTKIQ